MRPTTVLAAIAVLLNTSAFAQQSDAVRCVDLMNQGKFFEAEEHCLRAAENSPESRLYYAAVLFKKGNAKAAMKQYERLLEGMDRSRPSELHLAVLKDRAFVKLQTGDDAHDDISAYLAHRPDDVEALRVAVQSTPWNDKREAYANRLVTLKPQEMEFRLLLVDAYIKSGKGDQALEAAEGALTLDPQSVYALTWRAFAHGARGDFAKAERDHATVIRRMPKEPDARTNRAETLVQLKRHADAIEAATGALALKPNDTRALQLRAHAKLQMGDAEGALADAEAAAQADENVDISEFAASARLVRDTQQALQAGALPQLTADRQVVLGAFSGGLGGKCGYYSVPNHEDNEGLNAYRDCIEAWYKADEPVVQEPPESAQQAAERFFTTIDLLDDAEALRCSKMPRRSRCVDDDVYRRIESLAAHMDNPKLIIARAEFDRLNQEVNAYNARLGRQEALTKTAGFLQAVADALSEQ